jgi:3-polyprenyl-4-hydroxybenzoate decarboxylase
MVVSLVDIAAERERSNAQNLTISRGQCAASNQLVEEWQENTVHARVLHEDAGEIEMMPIAYERLLLVGEPVG